MAILHVEARKPSFTSPLSMNLTSFHYGVAGLFPFLLLLLRLLLL